VIHELKKERNMVKKALGQVSSFQSVNNRILSYRIFDREGHSVLFPVFVCGPLSSIKYQAVGKKLSASQKTTLKAIG
jgi:hypothetical protein